MKRSILLLGLFVNFTSVASSPRAFDIEKVSSYGKLLGTEYFVKLDASKEFSNEVKKVEINLEINKIKMQIPKEVLNGFIYISLNSIDIQYHYSSIVVLHENKFLPRETFSMNIEYSDNKECKNDNSVLKSINFTFELDGSLREIETFDRCEL